MCVVSMVGDYWSKRTLPSGFPNYDRFVDGGEVNRVEFEALKKSVEELKKLLIAAQKYDEAQGEPHCKHEDKVALIRKLAELVGVDMRGVLD